jgi:hypothetical protein
MNRVISYVFVLSLLFFTTTLLAQDVVILRNGDEQNVKLLEITSETVRYQILNSSTEEIKTIPKSEIFMIKYSNGQKDVFNTKAVGDEAAPEIVVCLPSTSGDCKSIKNTPHFTATKGGTSICIIVRGVLTTETITFRIKRSGNDYDVPMKSYRPQKGEVCMKEEIVIKSTGEHRIEILNDKHKRIAVTSFTIKK